MEQIQVKEIKISKKIAPKLPERLILYVASNEFFILAPEQIPFFDETAIWKGEIHSRTNKDLLIFEIPLRIYEFYQLDENDYTVMVSEKTPKVIQVHI